MNIESSSMMYITIIISSALVMLIAGIVFVVYRIFFIKATTNEYTEPRENGGEGMEMSTLPPEIFTNSTSPDDHIYEEIPEIEEPYDHLRFSNDPMPISNDNHYHNADILQRRRRNNT